MRSRTSLLAIIGTICGSSLAIARTGYYQFPDLHDHAIVFAAEGDLWTVADTGDEAIMFGGRYDDERGVAEHLGRETHVGRAAPPVEHDHRCTDSQQRVVADHRVDRVPCHEHHTRACSDTTRTKIHNRAVDARDKLGVRELVLVVGDCERIRFA